MAHRGTPHPPETRASAEFLYVIERKDKSQVCELLGISGSTFDRWKKDGKWDDKRALEVLSVPLTVRMMQRDIERTYRKADEEDRPLTSGERDGVYKTIKQIQALDKGALFASHTIQAMDLFGAFLAEAAPDLKEQLTPLMVEFVQKVTVNYASA